MAWAHKLAQMSQWDFCGVYQSVDVTSLWSEADDKVFYVEAVEMFFSHIHL